LIEFCGELHVVTTFIAYFINPSLEIVYQFFLLYYIWRPHFVFIVIVMVVWTGSVVSLLYEAIYSSARIESSKPVGTSKVNGSHTVNTPRCM